MRLFLLSCAALAFGGQAVAKKLDLGEEAVAGPGGVYTSLTNETEAACARRCEADGLCLGWTFLKAGACVLKPIARAPALRQDARSGLRPRAPDFAAALPSAAAPIANADGALLGGPSDDTPEALRPRLGSTGTW